MDNDNSNFERLLDLAGVARIDDGNNSEAPNDFELNLKISDKEREEINRLLVASVAATDLITYDAIPDPPKQLTKLPRDLSEHDLLVPLHITERVMRYQIPKEAKISKEAKIAMQEAASEFVSFICNEAVDLSNSERRRTVKGSDVVKALNNLGLDHYLPFATKVLEKIREISKHNNS